MKEPEGSNNEGPAVGVDLYMKSVGPEPESQGDRDTNNCSHSGILLQHGSTDTDENVAIALDANEHSEATAPPRAEILQVWLLYPITGLLRSKFENEDFRFFRLHDPQIHFI